MIAKTIAKVTRFSSRCIKEGLLNFELVIYQHLQHRKYWILFLLIFIRCENSTFWRLTLKKFKTKEFCKMKVKFHIA